MTGGQGCEDNAPLKHCPGMTDTEYRTEFAMWCIMGSSLIVATDIRNMTDIMKEVRMICKYVCAGIECRVLHCHVLQVLLNKELIHVNQDKNGMYIHIIFLFLDFLVLP